LRALKSPKFWPLLAKVFWWARRNGAKAAFVESADSINHEMPKFVAERALNLVDSSIKNPKVFILGVAYKPEVGDVRETPVSELRDYLKVQGVDVAWHDPLVPVWEGTNPVDLDWNCDVAILATKQPGVDLSQLINRGVLILDCANPISAQSGVNSL
jgi:UDP-N-acetyl-D-glucosamine dehydrogenase